jgi:hypothetical protein
MCYRYSSRLTTLGIGCSHGCWLRLSEATVEVPLISPVHSKQADERLGRIAGQT